MAAIQTHRRTLLGATYAPRPHLALAYPFTTIYNEPGGATFLNTDSWTWMGWVTVDSYTNPPGLEDSDDRQMLFIGNGPNDYSLFIRLLAPGYLQVYSYQTGQSAVYANGNNKVGAGQTRHVGVVHDGMSLRLFLGGARVLTSACPQVGGNFRPVNRFSQGCVDSARTSGNFNGRLDEVALLNVGLTDAEMATWYNRPVTALVAHFGADVALAYDFEEPVAAGGGAGDLVATDRSDHGRHLTTDGFLTNTTVPATAPIIY